MKFRFLILELSHLWIAQISCEQRKQYETGGTFDYVVIQDIIPKTQKSLVQYVAIEGSGIFIAGFYCGAWYAR